MHTGRHQFPAPVLVSDLAAAVVPVLTVAVAPAVIPVPDLPLLVLLFLLRSGLLRPFTSHPP